MKINVEYKPGYDFWVPRVVEKAEKETILKDGKEYSRYEKVLTVLAPHKIVKRVNISISSEEQVTINYYCVDYDNRDTLPRKYHTDEMSFRTEEHALGFARKWLESEKCEYYGMTDEDSGDYGEE
jgi:hypothetical protein